MITNAGNQRIGRALSDYLASHIAVGIGVSPVTAEDTRLQFEVSRAKINVSSYDYTEGIVTLKATLDQFLEGSITEIGLVSSSSDSSGGRLIFGFDPAQEMWSGGTWVTENVHLGNEGMGLLDTAATVSNVNVDLSVFEAQDVMEFAYYGTGGTLTVRLLNDATNYFEYTFPVLAGFNVHSQNFGTLTPTGVPELGSIRAMTITHSGGGGITMDGLRAARANEETVLIARNVPTVPIIKELGRSLDIEFPLGLTL